MLRHTAGLQLKALASIGAPVCPRGTEIWAVLAANKLIVVPRDATDPA